MSTATARSLTQAQRGTFARHCQRIYNKALHTLGRDAEDITRMNTVSTEDNGVMSSATFKLGEVVYTITITGKREEATG